MLRVLVALVALLAASSSAAFINEDFGRGPAFEHLRKDLRSASSISTRGAGSAEVVGLASQLNRQARDEHRDEHHGAWSTSSTARSRSAPRARRGPT